MRRLVAVAFLCLSLWLPLAAPFGGPGPSSPARAQGDSARFSGVVRVRGVVPPEGLRIEARVASQVCGSTVTTRLNGEARYTVDVPAGRPCGGPGLAVSFFVAGEAAGSALWVAGLVDFDLVVPLPASSPATATPTVSVTAGAGGRTPSATAPATPPAATPRPGPVTPGTAPSPTGPAPAAATAPSAPVAPTPTPGAAPSARATAPPASPPATAAVPAGACGTEGPLTADKTVGCGSYELSFPLSLRPGESRNVTLEVTVTESTVTALLRVEKPTATTGLVDDLGQRYKDRYVVYERMIASLEAPALQFAEKGRWVPRDVSDGHAVWIWNVQAGPGESGPQVLVVRVGPNERNVVTFPPAEFGIEGPEPPDDGTPVGTVVALAVGALAVVGGFVFNVVRKRPGGAGGSAKRR